MAFELRGECFRTRQNNRVMCMKGRHGSLCASDRLLLFEFILLFAMFFILTLVTGCSALPKKGKPAVEVITAASDDWVLTYEESGIGNNGEAIDRGSMKVATYDIDDCGRVILETHSVAGVVTQQRELSYGSDGNLAIETKRNYSSGELDSTWVDEYSEYDSRGTAHTISTVSMDAAGNVTDSFMCHREVDSNGNVTSEVSTNADGTLHYRNDCTIDNNGNEVERHYVQALEDGTSKTIDDYREYEDGRLIREQHFFNGDFSSSMRHEWEDSGRRESIIPLDEEGNPCGWENKLRDDKENLLYWIQQSGSQVWGYSYDGEGRLLEEVHWSDEPDGYIDFIKKNIYDSFGNLINTVDSHFDSDGFLYAEYTARQYTNVKTGQQSNGAALEELEPQIVCSLVSSFPGTDAVVEEDYPNVIGEQPSQTTVVKTQSSSAEVSQDYVLNFTHGEYSFNVTGINLLDGVATAFARDFDAISLHESAFVMNFYSDEMARSRLHSLLEYSDNELTFVSSYGGVVSMYEVEDCFHLVLIQTGISYRPIAFWGAEAASVLEEEGVDTEYARVWRAKMCECCNLPADTDDETINAEFCKMVAERVIEAA